MNLTMKEILSHFVEKEIEIQKDSLNHPGIDS